MRPRTSDSAVDAGRFDSGAPILLDVSRLIWRAWDRRLPTGIDRTCLAYVAYFRDRALAVVQRGGVTRIFSADVSRRLFDRLLAPETTSRLELAKLSALGTLSTHRGPVAGLVYFNVGHTGLDKPGHADWIHRTGVRPVYFIHDLIPLTHPEYCRRGEPERHLRRITALLALGAGVVANSRQTLNELAVFAGLQKTLDMPPGLVAPLGVGHSAMACGGVERIPLPGRPYFVVLGTIEARKNHLLILNVWAALARRLGPQCPQLVIVGQRGWECEQAVDMLERCEAIRGHVIELSRCGDAQLRAYLANARALLFPSFAEGYGLPLVEALGEGTPVIASDLDVFRELAGDIPEYLDPIDGLGWSRAIEAYARDGSPARKAQVERMSGWAAPTWEEHFRRVERWVPQLSPVPQSRLGSNG